jgi:predicted O-methyltransferase YrrM
MNWRHTKYSVKIRKLFAGFIATILPTGIMKDKAFFPLWERHGYHVTPIHYYEPIPDTRELNPNLWLKHSKLAGINLNEKGQLGLLNEFVTEYKEEYERFPRTPTSDPYQYYVDNGLFESVDGEILYCMVRHFKPHRIFEIGSGYTTLLSAQAIIKNMEEADHNCDLIAIEPYPREILVQGFPGLKALEIAKVQDLPLSRFNDLRENDILFIDSSHVVKINNDVCYEFLEILPRIRKGVLVHIHDIFLPAEYPMGWILKEFRFWAEQYLLQAFLIYNNCFEVLWAGSFMHLNHPDKLESAFNSYSRNTRWPGSFWIRRTC